jgi:hypothetical protein
MFKPYAIDSMYNFPPNSFLRKLNVGPTRNLFERGGAEPGRSMARGEALRQDPRTQIRDLQK